MVTGNVFYDFLTSDDNLNYIVELSNELDHFRKEMHILFWEKYNTLMSQKLAESEYCFTWKFTPFNLKHRLTDWERSSLTTADSDSTKIKLLFYFLQESPEVNFRLNYCVRWNKKSSEVKYDSPKIAILKSKLYKYKINIPSDWEYLYGFSQWQIYDALFLRRMYKETEVFVQEIVDHNWNMFLDIRPEIEEINSEINYLFTTPT